MACIDQVAAVHVVSRLTMTKLSFLWKTSYNLFSGNKYVYEGGYPPEKSLSVCLLSFSSVLVKNTFLQRFSIV